MNILGIGLLLLQVQLAGASGMVTKPGGSEPLPKASVVLSPVASGPNERLHSAVTEEDGRFTIRDIEPGDYRLFAQNPRYGQTAFGQRKPGGPGTILSIAPGQQLTGLRLSMVPTGTIAGHITGRNGEPLVNAAVQALKYTYRDEKKVLTTAQIANTDDRGEYHLFWLPAGQCYVAATVATGGGPVGPTAIFLATPEPLRPGTSSPQSGDTIPAQLAFQVAELLRRESPLSVNTTRRILDDRTVQNEAWVPVYDPAAAESRRATAIDLAAGTTRSGIDLVMSPAVVHKVWGQVGGFTPGSTPTVQLLPQNPTSRVPSFGTGGSSVDGSFEFTGVMPGSYYVVARDVRTGVVSAPMPVEVGDSDVANVTVGVTQTVSVTGRIVLEGATPPSGDPNLFAGISVSLQPDISGILPGTMGTFSIQPTAGTGAFASNNVAPGDYQIQISSGVRPNAKPLYLKSVRLGVTDATAVLHIDGTTNDRIEIVLTTDAGAAEGVAIGSRSGAASNATVVLIPNVARRRSNLYRAVVTGPDGRFRFQDLTPGDYKLFAWDDVETGACQDLDCIRQYESKGLLVHIAEKGKEDVQLNVIYNP